MTTKSTTVSHAKSAAKAKATVAKLKQTTIDLTPTGPELVFLPLDLIDTRAQVRTEFDDETLAELAADIRLRGVLQPVLARPDGAGRFILIAGERRVRAARLAELTAVPAMIGQVDDDTAADMQLAENIQREELSLPDTVAAIRRLFDRLGSLQAVADRVGKSKPWVSKHVSMSQEEFGWAARALLSEGLCEDIETLLALSKCYQYNSTIAGELYELIKQGKAGRKTAREHLAKAKQIEADRKAEQAEANSPEAMARRAAEREAQNAEGKRANEQRLAERREYLKETLAAADPALADAIRVLVKRETDEIEDPAGFEAEQYLGTLYDAIAELEFGK